MGIRIGSFYIGFSFWFFVVIVGFLLLDREVLAFYLVLPIVVHELGHLLVLLLCGCHVEAICFTAVSVDIRRDSNRILGYWQEIAISLAGIMANFLMALYLYLFAFQSMRTMFLISANLVAGIFNLLPISSLDGGDIVKLLAERFSSSVAAYRISKITSVLVLAPLFGLAIFLCLQGIANITLLVTCVYLLIAILWKE